MVPATANAGPQGTMVFTLENAHTTAGEPWDAPAPLGTVRDGALIDVSPEVWTVPLRRGGLWAVSRDSYGGPLGSWTCSSRRWAFSFLPVAMVTSLFSSLSPARSRDWPEALHWYSTALEKTDCDEGGEYDGVQDEPRYALLAREAEMLSVGGFRLQKDPQRSGRSGDLPLRRAGRARGTRFLSHRQDKAACGSFRCTGPHSARLDPQALT